MWQSWWSMFVTWVVIQYFPNDIVASAGTRDVAINLIMARGFWFHRFARFSRDL
jgi:hypothetical protein